MTVAAMYDLKVYSVVFVDIDYYIPAHRRLSMASGTIAPSLRKGGLRIRFLGAISHMLKRLTVIAVYRTTVVTPTQQPLRFVEADTIKAGEHYIFAVKNAKGEHFALSVLDRLSGNGLWGIEIKVDRRGIVPQNEQGNLEEVIFVANKGNDGFRLASIITGQYLTASDGYVQMQDVFPLYADSFDLVSTSGKSYLYNAKRDVYLSFDDEGYFKTYNIQNACEISVYKHIRISADYIRVHTPETGKNYYIVAQKSGISYALTYKEGRISTIPVDIIDDKLYFYDNVNEQLSAFRFIYGDNYKGFNLRNVANSEFLAVANNSYITTPDIFNAGYFVYQNVEDQDFSVFFDYVSNKYLYCDDLGNAAADNEEFSEILLFERVPKDGRVGDVNMDSNVNTGDATLMLRHLVGKIKLNDAQLKLFDTNGDRNKNTGDVSHLLRYAIGEVDWIGD